MLSYNVTQPSILINAVPSVASIKNIQTNSKVETKTITVTATLSSSVQSTYTFSNKCSDQTLKSETPNTAWIVLAILFLVMAVSGFVVSIIMGYVLYKKTNTLEKSSISTSAPTSGTNEPVKEGTVGHNK